MPILAYILTALAAYLLGSIPTGFLVAKAKGIDIRTVGSGNIGATNAMRVLGKPAGIFVLLHGCVERLVCLLVRVYLSIIFNLSVNATSFGLSYLPRRISQIRNFAIIAGIFAVLGHNYTCWLKFKGGKGIATTAGVYLALAPWALLDCAGGFYSGGAADAICFRRFHRGGGCVARRSLDYAAA